MQIQQYNLYTQHISGADSFLADTLSRNRADLCERDTQELFKPKDMAVAAAHRSADSCVGGRLKELLTCQACEKGIQEIIRIVEQNSENAKKKSQGAK
jgi:hypothetical protein